MCEKLKTFVQRVQIFVQRVKTIIAFNITLASFFLHASLLCPFFLCFARDKLLLPKSFLSAGDETSNVLKRSGKNMFAYVLALCFILRLLTRSNHYAPKCSFIFPASKIAFSKLLPI